MGGAVTEGFALDDELSFASVWAIFSFCGSEDFTALTNFKCLIGNFLGYFENVDRHENELCDRAAENAMEILIQKFVTAHSFLDKGSLIVEL